MFGFHDIKTLLNKPQLDCIDLLLCDILLKEELEKNTGHLVKLCTFLFIMFIMVNDSGRHDDWDLLIGAGSCDSYEFIMGC